MDKFNIFKILSKDDKELIHSAFIKFLLDEYPFVFEDLFNLKNVKFDKAELEKSERISISKDEADRLGIKYSKLNNSGEVIKHIRIDINVKSTNSNHRVLIENKFKSFPNQTQLDLYNKIDIKADNVHKYLFCFDKSIINFETGDWEL